MLATCLINSYNYRPYVGEAVESALRQSRPFDQILVVDDGSSDGSLELLEQQYGREPRVQIIGKTNGGQLSCFNHAIRLVSGELLFFLDADDRYRPSYLADALACYERTGADFLIAGFQNFGVPERPDPKPISRERDWGMSVLTTLFEGTWIGAPTSCLSMGASLARRILPSPFETQWRIQADNVLVYGASLLGAHKYQLGKPLIERRVHGANLYYGRRADPLATMRFALAKNRLIAWYAEQAGYNVADLPRLLSREFRTLERPTIKEYRRYLRMSWNSRLPVGTRANQFLSLTAHMLKGRRPGSVGGNADLAARSSSQASCRGGRPRRAA
jgi:glycosyltransferase involved in cell wall biosynthesis